MLHSRLTTGILGLFMALGFVLGGCGKSPLEPSDEASPLARAVPAVSNSYIVILSESVKNVPEVANEMARTHRAMVEFTYQHALKGFSATIPLARLNDIKNDPRVLSVGPDLIATASKRPAPVTPPQPEQTLPWGIDKIDADESSTESGNRSGDVGTVEIYVLDTGIDMDHPELNVVGGINCIRSTRTYDDDNGHGTHVAGIIAARDDAYGVVGVAPGAQLYAVKVLDRSGSGSFSQIIAGIDWVAGRKTANSETPMVANMSLGAVVYYTGYNELDKAVKGAIAKGVVFTLAAGNESVNANICSPAHVTEAITVGAYDSGMNFAYFSNYGNIVDLNAPGVSIYSTYKGGVYATKSGTSMAAPHVAGTAALYLSQHPNDDPAAVLTALESAAEGSGLSVISSVTVTNLSVYAGTF